MNTEGDWRMLLLPLSHLCVVSTLVWVYAHVAFTGSTVARGIKIGFVGWIVSYTPLWLLWYAQQPWPDSMVVKQLCLELVSSLIIGMTIAAVAGHGRDQRREAIA